MSSFIVAKVLKHIFNCNIFPKVFKVAKVIIIFNEGDKFDKCNYRLISVLPVMSLILERHFSKHENVS